MLLRDTEIHIYLYIKNDNPLLFTSYKNKKFKKLKQNIKWRIDFSLNIFISGLNLLNLKIIKSFNIPEFFKVYEAINLSIHQISANLWIFHIYIFIWFQTCALVWKCVCVCVFEWIVCVDVHKNVRVYLCVCECVGPPIFTLLKCNSYASYFSH